MDPASIAYLGSIDYLVLVALFVFSLLIGLYFAWKDRNKGTNEFLMGGRNLSPFPVMLSLIASFLSSITVLGWPAEVYYKGTQIWITLLSCYVEVFLTSEVILPIFYKLNLTSVNRYLYERYGSNFIMIMVSIVGCIATFPWLGVVLYGPSLALGAVTGLSVTASILLCGLICTVYTALGGLKAVIWTDVLQYFLMILGIVVVIVKGIIDTGGVAEVWRRADLGGRLRLFDSKIDFYNSHNQWTTLMGTTLVWTAGLSTSQALLQRTLSMPTLKKAKMVVYLALPGFQSMQVLVTTLGVVAFAYYYDCDPLRSKKIAASDQLIPYFVTDLFSSKYPGLPGLFVACVFSSTLSTLSSAFNAVAAVIWDDWLKRCFPKASVSAQVTITKIIAALAGLVCIGVAFLASQAGTLFEASYSLSGSPLGPAFAVFILGIFAPFVNSKGAIIGYLAGQITCVWIVIGGLVIKRPILSLEVSTEGCSANTTYLEPGLLVSQLKDYRIPEYHPEGIAKIYHVSHFIIPAIGFLVALIVGILFSLLTGCNRDKCVNPDLVLPCLRKYCCVKNDPKKCNKFKKHQMKQNDISETIPMKS
ncbi:sodium-coupled monocarboxylate transporter 2 [Tetranychus urticae]|uniref:Sodium/solute symporter n=1 Tax=Tetranychus urticae TaxID=32264 RepID=T1JYJ9_TETUR|nr:sodium-coupled monocarboxylate transporter 2 [Tetranychus urticae]